MVFGDWGIIPPSLGWSPILCNDVLLTMLIDKSMGEGGKALKYFGNFAS